MVIRDTRATALVFPEIEALPRWVSKPVEAASLETSIVDARVVLLTHYVPLYQVRVFQELRARVRDLKILLSTPIEPNRDFTPDWSGLDVTVQKSLMFRRRWRQGTGFNDELYVHIPYDTLGHLHRFRPDVILSHELGARSMAAALYRRLLPRNRLVLMTYMSEHTEHGRGKMRTRLRRRLLSTADAVTFNGPSCQRYLQRMGVPHNRLFHLPYAADDRAGFEDIPLERSAATRNRLICVGQLNERKGVMPLVQQISRYCQQRPSRKITLVMVGQGDLQQTIESMERPANFTLEMVGNVAPHELTTLYAGCGAAVHATLADEWLMVVNESLHAGLPVIGSRYAQGVETLIRDGVNGWVFDPLQMQQLDAKLDAYFALTDHQLLNMRWAARSSIAQRTPAWAAAGAVAAIQSVLH